MNKNKIFSQIKIIDDWFLENTFKGIDIYDLYDTKLFHYFLGIKIVLIKKIFRKIISYFILFFPKLTIILFNKKVNYNSKSLGLILKGYCNLYENTRDSKYLNKAEELAVILLGIQSKGYKGISWGYPFDWTSKVFVPKNTPSSVVSCIIGDAFFALYKFSNKDSYLKICIDICHFLVESLNIDMVDSERICFSYTPIDKNHVHNANLFAAAFLIRVGRKINNQKYVELGIKALNYSISELKSDGSLAYWGNVDKSQLKYKRSENDHYHIGFELRCLEGISNLIDIPELKDKIEKYYKYYLKNYIGENEIFLKPNTKYPINIHGCSEFIILNSIFHRYPYGLSKEKFLYLADILVDTMIDPKDNLFIYQINKTGPFYTKCKYKFFRWSQAWMFLALTELIKEVDN